MELIACGPCDPSTPGLDTRRRGHRRSRDRRGTPSGKAGDVDGHHRCVPSGDQSWSLLRGRHLASGLFARSFAPCSLISTG